MLRARNIGLVLLAAAISVWSQPKTLPPDGAAEGDLAAGNADRFSIDVPGSEFVRVILNGYGGLLNLEILDAQGKTLAKESRTGGIRDPISWAAVLEQPGRYQLRVTSGEGAGRLLHYRMAVQRRPAGERDRMLVSAQGALNRGEKLQDAGQAKDAIAEFELAAQLAAQAADTSLEGEAWLHLAEARFTAGRTAPSESAFESAIETWRGASDEEDEARALRGLGKLYGDTQQAAKAVATLDQALGISENRGDAAGQAEALRELGSVAGAHSEYVKAEDLFRRGLALARQASDRRTEADLLNMLGVLDQNTGKDADALENYQAALAIRRAISDSAGVAQSTTNLGVFHRNLGEARAAVADFAEALALRRKFNNAQGTATTLENLAVAQADLGNLEESLALSREAADLFHSSQGRRGETFALINLGDVYARLGDADKALDYYVRARNLAKAVGDHRAEAIVLLSTGAIYDSRREFDTAWETYSEALRISRTGGDKREEARALMALAETDMSRGDAGVASSVGREALEAIGALDDRREEARALSFLGAALLDSDRAQALAMLHQALEIQQEIVDPEPEAATRSRLARAAEEGGDLAGAREQALAALDLIESVRRNAPPAGPRVSFQASQQPFYQQAIDILMAMHRQDSRRGYDAEALQVSERARARALLDQLAQSKISLNLKIAPALAQEAARTLELLDAKAARLTAVLSGRHTPQQAEGARREVDQLEARYDETRAQIRSRCPQCDALADPRPLSLVEIQRQVLDANSALFEYSLGTARGYLWVVTKTSLQVYELPARGEIEKLVRGMRAELAEPARVIENETEQERELRCGRSDAEFERVAAELKRAVLAPAAELHAKRILIAPDGPLNGVPFAALVPPGMETVEIPSASSLAFLLRNRENRTSAPDSIAVFADPAYPAGSTEFPRLRLSREEGLRIAGLAPGKKEVVLGAEATRARVENPSLAQYAILHFAAHAWIDEDRPELSGIALTDGIVRLNDIYHLSLNARLVVLSACRTALGKAEGGEGPISLARAFLYAGASGVVASLWDVDDRATEVFMTHFYEGLFRRKLPADAALQYARDAMRTSAAWRHPYYWAGFVFIGDSASTRHG